LVISIVRIDTVPGRRIDEIATVTGVADGEYQVVTTEVP